MMAQPSRWRCRETPGSQRNRNRGDDHADYCGQTQEFFRTVKRRADLGTGIAYPFNPLPGLQARQCPFPVRFHALIGSRNLQPVKNAAAVLNQTGGTDIGLVQNDARTGVDESDRAIRLLGKNRRDAERAGAKTHAIAYGQLKLREQLLVDPHRPRRGDGFRAAIGAIKAIGDAQLAAQRVARADHFDAGKHVPVVA